MRIFGLRVFGFKGVRAVEVEFDPDGNLVVVTGRNGAGKSSVLDSIWVALSGKAAPKRPIHDGESEASVSLEIGDSDGNIRYVVHRRFTASGPKLVVESADGARYQRAQELLDGFVGALSFDPLAFTKLRPQEQVEALLAIVDLPFDPVALDAEYDEVFEERTVTNRMVKELAAQIEAIPYAPEGTPDEEVAVTDLANELAAAQAKVSERAEAVAEKFAATDAFEATQERCRILREQYDAALADLERDGIRKLQADTRLDQLPDESESVAALNAVKARLGAVDAVNAAVRAKRDRARQVDRLDLLEATAAEQTARLEAIREKRREGIAEADMPVDGLGFGPDGVTYRNVPYAQCSTAEQIKVAVGIAMAANPELRVLRIAEGGLLDADTLAVIESMAGDRDYQVFVEVVNLPGGDPGCQVIEIVDGAVAEESETP